MIIIKNPTPIKIIVPYYNCYDFIFSCIKTIKQQRSKFYTTYLINDCSTDNTNNILKLIAKHKIFKNHFIHIENKKRRYQILNHYDIIHKYCDDEDIIISLDGDDKFAHNDVIGNIRRLYMLNKDLWLTYGSFKTSEGRRGFASKILNYNTVRQDPWRATHLKTWKAWLFKKIKYEDLIAPNGDSIKYTGDMGMMFPMLEMAGEKHSMYLNKIHYTYNLHNNISDSVIHIPDQREWEHYFRNKEPYKPL